MKKPRAILFVFLFSLMRNHSFCQDEKFSDNKFCIKTSPLALIDVYGSYSWRLGTEFKVSGNTAMSLEYGTYFNYGNNRNINLRWDSKGFIIRPELKVYLNREKFCSGPFLSLEYLYKDIAFNFEDSIKLGSNPPFFKDYRIFKHISAITVKYGELRINDDGFIFEWYVGAGVRICRGHNTLTPEEDKGVLTGEGHGDVISAGQRWVNYVAPNLSAGFKIGWRLK